MVKIKKEKFFICPGTINYEDYPILSVIVVVALVVFIGVGMGLFLHFLPYP